MRSTMNWRSGGESSLCAPLRCEPTAVFPFGGTLIACLLLQFPTLLIEGLLQEIRVVNCLRDVPIGSGILHPYPGNWYYPSKKGKKR